MTSEEYYKKIKSRIGTQYFVSLNSSHIFKEVSLKIDGGRLYGKDAICKMLEEYQQTLNLNKQTMSKLNRNRKEYCDENGMKEFNSYNVNDYTEFLEEKIEKLARKHSNQGQKATEKLFNILGIIIQTMSKQKRRIRLHLVISILTTIFYYLLSTYITFDFMWLINNFMDHLLGTSGDRIDLLGVVFLKVAVDYCIYIHFQD